VSQTILIVEDTDDDVFFLKRALRDSGIGHPLQVVVDGRHALDYLQGNGEFSDRTKFPLPFLILLDLKLPYVMGLDVLRWIRQQPEYADILVVVLTSSQHDADMEETFKLGGNAYLIKPATRAKLLEMVQNLRERWFGS
jgi:CheY-like chemotaxis protein